MTTHRLVATAWHNVIGSLPPVLTIASGDTVVTETIDANGFDKDGVSRAGSPNPMNGPVFVEGAEPGDALRVEILDIAPASSRGWTRTMLAYNVVDPLFVREALGPSPKVYWTIERNARTVRLEEPPPALKDWVLPFEPMIGCFGVAPSYGQAIGTMTSGEYGGNMDYRRFTTGTSVSFPVSAPGALFFVGDCHAIQGDGEITGTGVETCCEVTLRLTLEKGRKITWPRGETADDIFTIGNARPLDQALQHATTEMAKWLGEDFGLDVVSASHFLGQVVRYDIGNVFDPAYTVACRVAKSWLKRG
jgi:acetamidase/formamidase